MKARVLDRSDVLKITDLLRQRGYEVIAPVGGRGRDTFFDTVTNQNRNQIQIHLPNPYYPPKRYVFPPLERLMKAERSNGDLRIEPTFDLQKRAIFGIRSCDVAGIYHLDRFYLGREFPDIYYQSHRKNLFLVNVACTDPELDIGEECFCMCTDTGPAARDHFDLQLFDLRVPDLPSVDTGNEFLVVAGTPAGEALFANPIFRKAKSEHVARRRAILEKVRKSFKPNTTSWFSAAIQSVSRGEIRDETWDEIGNRCLECGGCTYVCPACTCFTVTDRPLESGGVERLRVWDSCALSGFTRMAGGFNPRRAVHDRRNRRFFRKLAHYFIERELSMACVGCGRCAAVCHGDIGMPSVVETIRRSAALGKEA